MESIGLSGWRNLAIHHILYLQYIKYIFANWHLNTTAAKPEDFDSQPLRGQCLIVSVEQITLDSLACHIQWRGAKPGFMGEEKESSFGSLNCLSSLLKKCKLCFLPSPTLLLLEGHEPCGGKTGCYVDRWKYGWGLEQGRERARSMRPSQFQIFFYTPNDSPR